MSVETAFRLTGPALEIKGATENLSALPEFSGGEVTETELPVRKMVRPADPVTVFSAYSPVETITELPQAENGEAKPTSWPEGITRHKKEAAAVGIFATQTAFSGSSFGVGAIGGGMIGMGLAEFIKPLFKHDNDRAVAGYLITVGGGVIGGFWAESVKITQALPFVTFEAMTILAFGLGGFFGVRSLVEKWLQEHGEVNLSPSPRFEMKVQKGEVKEKRINWKVQKGLEKETKMKIRLKG